MERSDAAEWLGLERTGDDRWRLAVHEGVVSGASALFGGCATAAAIVAAQAIAPQPVVWASAHFGTLAKLASVVDISVRTMSSGRTMSHVEVRGDVEGRESFVVRIATGERPAHPSEGQWIRPPDVPAPDDCSPFAHPVHEATWASRFEFRLAGTGAYGTPWAAWWVRGATPPAIDPMVAATVLNDYVTYGIGRALGEPMGGLSIDNVVRLHRPGAAADSAWVLVVVRPEAIEGGFGHGSSRVFAGDTLVATGSQSMVMNTWDWRLPSERDDTASPATENA